MFLWSRRWRYVDGTERDLEHWIKGATLTGRSLSVVTSGGSSLSDGDSYTIGETLTMSISSSSGGQCVFTSTAGTISSGSCSSLRKCSCSSPSITMPSSGSVTLAILWASGYSTVYKSNTITLAASVPSSQPSPQPSSLPSAQPSSLPSAQPTTQPSIPTSQPTAQPTSQPTRVPTAQPTSQPTAEPTTQPTSKPSAPTSAPTTAPSPAPSPVPTIFIQVGSREETDTFLLITIIILLFCILLAIAVYMLYTHFTKNRSSVAAGGNKDILNEQLGEQYVTKSES
jgi:hypothetical protein